MPVARVLFTDRRDEIVGAKLGISLREDSGNERRFGSESVQAPLCMTPFVIPGCSREYASVFVGSRGVASRDYLQSRQPAAGGRVAGAIEHEATFVATT